MGFFDREGFKRQIAALLSVVVEVLRLVPGAGQFLWIIEAIAAFFGITGIGHATAKGTLTRKKLATASAAVASLIAVCYFIPVLAPLIPYLQTLAALLGSAALGAQAKQAEVNNKTLVEPKNINSV